MQSSMNMKLRLCLPSPQISISCRPVSLASITYARGREKAPAAICRKVSSRRRLAFTPLTSRHPPTLSRSRRGTPTQPCPTTDMAGERMCRHFREEYGLTTRVARFHDVYGPNGTTRTRSWRHVTEACGDF